MALELYWVSGSPFSWRVMVTLEMKRLPYETLFAVLMKRRKPS
jgi:glutathione S-transferase